MTADCGVIVVAGGTSVRMGGEMPKQFRELSGIPVLCWSLRFFSDFDFVKELVLVAPEEFIEDARKICRDHLSAELHVVVGGRKRQDSVTAGIKQLSAQCEVVAVHDAARPFPPADFPQAVNIARGRGAAIFATPVSDTIKQVDHNLISATLNRETLWAAQTPQVFRRALLEEAMLKCAESGVTVTDDASAVEAIGKPVEIIPGPRTNLKLTYPEDWILAEAIAASRSEHRK